MEQRPAPCCRVSYCTDPVYTDDDDYYETTTDIDDCRHRCRCRCVSILPRFPRGFLPLFPTLEDFGAPLRTMCGCQHPLSVIILFRSCTASSSVFSSSYMHVFVVVNEVTFSQCIMFRCRNEIIFADVIAY